MDNNIKYKTDVLEDIFEIEENTTIAKIQQTQEIIEPKEDPEESEVARILNDEDKDIDTKLETIFSQAMEVFEDQSNMVKEVDPRFAARNAEVAAQYLTIALNAANSKANIRQNKLKIAKDGKKIGTVNHNNNVIVSSRNDILDLIERGEI